MLGKIRIWLIATGLVIISALSLSAVPTIDNHDAWKGLTPEQIEKVKVGKILILDEDATKGDKQQRYIQAAIVFDQPIDVVWKLLRATENQHRYLPSLKNCELVMRDNENDRVDFHVKMILNINYRVHHHYEDKNYHLWWHLDPNYENDIKKLDGFWKLHRVDDEHTLARYGTWVEVAFFIPDFIMKRLTRSNLPVNIEAVRKYIQSGGTYTKPNFEENK